MKKTPLFLACLALLAAGCNKVETAKEPAEEPAEVVPELKFNITANYDADTRAVKRGWVEGDKIYLAFDVSFQDEVAGFPTNHGYVTLTYDGSAFSNPTFSDPAFSKALQNAPEGKLAAAYVSGGNPQFQFEDLSTGNTSLYALSVTNSDELGGCILCASGVGYTISDNVLTANLDLTLDAGEGSNRYPVHFFLPSVSEENVSNYTLSCTEFFPDRFSCFLYISLSTEQPSVPRSGSSNTTYGNPIRGSYYDGGIEFVGMLKPDCKGVATDYVLVITDNQGTPNDDSDDIIYTIPKNATLKGKEAFNLPALTSPRWSTTNVDGTRGSLNGHEWVLMADGKKWATLNVGAGSETDRGIMTSWANTENCIEQNMGEGWRLPTYSEWSSFLTTPNHTKSWTYDSGVLSGFEVVVAEGELKGNRVFLPVSGFLDEQGVFRVPDSGSYWSSTPSDSDRAYAFGFDATFGFQPMNANCEMALRAIVDNGIEVNFNGYNDEVQW